ncbi:MAG: hypothetical protein ACE5HO_14740 [bacterium]
MTEFDENWEESEEFEDPDDWSEEQWEAFLQERDERDRRMMELLDKYGYDERGFRKAMEELGLGELYDELDGRADELEQLQDLAEDEQDGEEEIDHILRESRSANHEAEEPQYRHRLGQAAHELTTLVLDSLQGHDEIDSHQHPLAVYSGAYLDATGGLARLGYMSEWDDEEFDDDSPKNLIIVELKRVLRHLIHGLSLLDKIEQQKMLPAQVIAPIRLRTVAMLDDVRAELRQVRGQ